MWFTPTAPEQADCHVHGYSGSFMNRMRYASQAMTRAEIDGCTYGKKWGPRLVCNDGMTWAVIDRPYNLLATVGALYERPRCIFCAKPLKRTEYENWRNGYGPGTVQFRMLWRGRDLRYRRPIL